MMTMRVDRRRYRKSAQRSNSMNFSGTEDHADKKVSSASSTSTGTYHSDYGRKRSRYPDPNYSSPWDHSIAPLPTRIIRASATRKSNLLFNSSSLDINTEEDGDKITESNLLYINLIATSVEMGPMSFSVVKDSDHKKKQEQEMTTDMEEEMENLRNERERKKRAKEQQQRVSMPGLKSGSSTFFRPKKLWL